jgi:cytochrome P450
MADDVAAEQVLQIDNLPKSKTAYLAFKGVIGVNSMVSVGGERWKRLRKMFNPAFAPSHLETLIPGIVEESEVFIDRLKEVADTGEVVRMNEMTTVLCLKLPLIAVPDHRYHCEVAKTIQSSDGRVIFSIRLHTQNATIPMIQALTRLIADVNAFTVESRISRALNPLAYYSRWRDVRYRIPNPRVT